MISQQSGSNDGNNETPEKTAIKGRLHHFAFSAQNDSLFTQTIEVVVTVTISRQVMKRTIQETTSKLTATAVFPSKITIAGSKVSNAGSAETVATVVSGTAYSVTGSADKKGSLTFTVTNSDASND